jgi:hypothetical protein
MLWGMTVLAALGGSTASPLAMVAAGVFVFCIVGLLLGVRLEGWLWRHRRARRMKGD